MPSINPGPASTTTANTQSSVSNLMTLETLQVNLGSPAAVAANTSAEQTFSGLGTGLRAGDVIVAVSKPTAQAGLAIVGWRADTAVADKFYVTFGNFTASPITPTASQVYAITIARPMQPASGTTSVVVP